MKFDTSNTKLEKEIVVFGYRFQIFSSNSKFGVWCEDEFPQMAGCWWHHETGNEPEESALWNSLDETVNEIRLWVIREFDQALVS